MLLESFNSYIEILVGLNLGYAVFEYFRQELSTNIFNPKKISRKIEILQSRITVSKISNSDKPGYITQLDKISKRLKVASDKVDTDEKSDRTFFDILKPVSFMLGLLCIAYLLIAGFQAESLNQKALYSLFQLNLSCMIAVYCYSIFHCSFSRRILKTGLKISLPQIFVVFLTFSIISYLIVNIDIKHVPEWIKWILTGVVPILSHFLISIYNFRFEYDKNDEEQLFNLKDFYQIPSSKKLNLIMFALGNFIILLPYGLIIIYPEFNFLKYIAVLTIPLLLYIFLVIRVIQHVHKYQNKYQTLHNKQSDALNLLFGDDE